MAIVTDIKNLSQTAALNGPDGTVDPPASLDDQDRYLGSFIAMLRDGVGFTNPASITVPLGYTPLQQGDGIGQTAGNTNKIKIGWSAGGKLLLTVDTNAFGNIWPIDAQDAMQLRNGGTLAGALMTFTWTDPGSGGAYVWSGDGPASAFVRPASSLSVAYATNSSACSGNAATSSNASAVNGISGWNYSNRNYNPPYLWATAGSGGDQFLVQPGNLSVAYANSAGSAPANGGTATNSNQLGGQNPGYYINNQGSACIYIRNNATIQLIAGISGAGDFYWGINASDARLKKEIAPTMVDSLGQIARMRFVGFRWRDDMGFEIGDDTFNPVGVLAQEAEKIEPKWINNAGTWKQPDLYPMLMSAMHAIQQLRTQMCELAKLVNV